MPHGTIPQLALSSLDFHRLVSSADTDRTGGTGKHDERTRGADTSARHVRMFAVIWPDLQAACAHLRHASEARPAVSSVAPRKPADPLADRHRLCRSR